METEHLSIPACWRRRLEAWSRVAAPREACGLLLGRPTGSAALVERALWSVNLARSVERFELDPAAHLLGHLVAREEGLEVVGVWHSHPRADAQPSALDRAAAHPGWWYVIVGFEPLPELGAWWSGTEGLEQGLLA